MARVRVPKQVLLDGAQMSLTAFLAGTMGFLKERDIPIDDWVSYMGNRFADSWAGLKGEDLERVMQHVVVLRALPMGVELTASQLTSQKAEVELTPLPSRAVLEKFGTTPRGILRGFGVTQREIASIYGMFEPAAAAIGLKFTHQLKGGKQVLRVEQAAGPKRRTRSKAGKS